MTESGSYMTVGDDRRLELAVMHNHRELFRMNAEALGGIVRRDAGICYTFTGAGRQGMACLSDDGMDEGAVSGLGLDETRAALDRMMQFYRSYKGTGIGWWSLAPPRPAGIGALLLARGFQPGWQPCWMALDLQVGDETKAKGMIDLDEHRWPTGLRIEADCQADLQSVRGLPYADQGAVSRALMSARPDRVQQFIAVWNGKIVGHSAVFLSEGPLGVAGLYNVGVVPEARMQGVGKAVVIAACRWAREQGWRYAVLNGTGRRMYEQVGFRWIGDGDTWWGMNPAVYEVAPEPRALALAEAVGLGDVAALQQLADNWGVAGMPIGVEELERSLLNKQTLLQVAIHCKQSGAAQWLVDQGVSCTVLEAWDLGWKERAAEMLAKEPGLVNMVYGQGLTTLLHIASERGDVELARLALSARPNLLARDKFYRNTPLGWAKVFNRAEIVQMIENS